MPAIEYNKKASDSNIGFTIFLCSTFNATYELFSIVCPKYTSPKAPSPNFFLTLYFLNTTGFSLINLSSSSSTILSIKEFFYLF